MISTATNSITLKGGLVVSLDALQLLWAFEDRGCIVKVEDGALLVGPRSLITECRARTDPTAPRRTAGAGRLLRDGPVKRLLDRTGREIQTSQLVI